MVAIGDERLGRFELTGGRQATFAFAGMTDKGTRWLGWLR
jgi:hypothetical protein